MKKILILLLLLLLTGCSQSSDEEKLWNHEMIDGIEFNRNYTPSNYELNVIYYVLLNTPEINTHRMKGEFENTVYISVDDEGTGCGEAVFDVNGDLVTNAYNKGSYNYYCYNRHPIKHFSADILPWLIWGNSEDDSTTYDERMYHYILDLDLGIQSYIFSEDFDNDKVINFKELSTAEKMTYRLFHFMIFNTDYLIKLEDSNIDQFRNDSEFYYDYFDQIQNILELSFVND